MEKISKLLWVMIVALLCCSCTQRLTDFTVISTKNVPIGSGPTNLQKATTRVKGQDKAHIIICVPTGAPNLKEAIDRAIESYPGAVGLADGVVKQKFFYIPWIYGQSAFKVEDTPLFEVPAETPQQSTTAPKVEETSARNNGTPHEENFSILFFHEVVRGETLQSIANQYGVGIGDLIRWNQLSSSNVQPGTRLRILMR